MQLYDYFRSSASFRVRIALNLKQIEHTLNEIHLVKDGGEQHQAPYQAINPQGLVPTLVDDRNVLLQSMSMLEYLDEKYPTPPLLPQDLYQKAKVREFCYIIACDVHPLNNLRVLKYLKEDLGVDETQKMAWYHHWLKQGFNALEALIADTSDTYCFGDTVTMADCCLVPQMYNAYRFELPLTDFPRLVSIYENCMQLSAFLDASPK